jgi:hypothetical protein
MPATPPGKFTAPLAVADSHRNSRSGNNLVPRIASLMAGLSLLVAGVEAVPLDFAGPWVCRRSVHRRKKEIGAW